MRRMTQNHFSLICEWHPRTFLAVRIAWNLLEGEEGMNPRRCIYGRQKIETQILAQLVCSCGHFFEKTPFRLKKGREITLAAIASVRFRSVVADVNICLCFHITVVVLLSQLWLNQSVVVENFINGSVFYDLQSIFVLLIFAACVCGCFPLNSCCLVFALVKMFLVACDPENSSFCHG